MKKSMTIEELQKLKLEAEKKILDILIELNKETDCYIANLHYDDELIETVGGGSEMQVFDDVTIDIGI